MSWGCGRAFECVWVGVVVVVVEVATRHQTIAKSERFLRILKTPLLHTISSQGSLASSRSMLCACGIGQSLALSKCLLRELRLAQNDGPLGENVHSSTEGSILHGNRAFTGWQRDQATPMRSGFRSSRRLRS